MQRLVYIKTHTCTRVPSTTAAMPLLSVEVTTTEITVLVIVNTLQTCVKLNASISLCSLSLKIIHFDISKNQVSAIPLDIRTL